MKFKFIGKYTNGHTSNTQHGVTFEGNEPAEVTDPEAIRRLSGNVEFVACDPLDHDCDGKKGGSLPGKEVVRALREEYLKRTGKKPFAGWNEATLREKLSA